MNDPGRVGVLGARMMGAEMALAFARAGYTVVMREIEWGLVVKGKERQSHTPKEVDRWSGNE